MAIQTPQLGARQTADPIAAALRLSRQDQLEEQRQDPFSRIFERGIGNLIAGHMQANMAPGNLRERDEGRNLFPEQGGIGAAEGVGPEGPSLIERPLLPEDTAGMI